MSWNSESFLLHYNFFIFLWGLIWEAGISKTRAFSDAKCKPEQLFNMKLGTVSTENWKQEVKTNHCIGIQSSTILVVLVAASFRCNIKTDTDIFTTVSTKQCGKKGRGLEGAKDPQITQTATPNKITWKSFHVCHENHHISGSKKKTLFEFC